MKKVSLPRNRRVGPDGHLSKLKGPGGRKKQGKRRASKAAGRPSKLNLFPPGVNRPAAEVSKIKALAAAELPRCHVDMEVGSPKAHCDTRNGPKVRSKGVYFELFPRPSLFWSAPGRAKMAPLGSERLLSFFLLEPLPKR